MCQEKRYLSLKRKNGIFFYLKGSIKHVQCLFHFLKDFTILKEMPKNR